MSSALAGAEAGVEAAAATAWSCPRRRSWKRRAARAAGRWSQVRPWDVPSMRHLSCLPDMLIIDMNARQAAHCANT